MLFSSFSTRSMVFAYFAKAQLPFSLFRDLFNDTAEFTLCYGLHDCSPLFQGYFIHSLSTLYYYNAPSLATQLTGDYRDRTYTGKCSPALLDTRITKGHKQNIVCGLNSQSFIFDPLKGYKNQRQPISTSASPFIDQLSEKAPHNVSWYKLVWSRNQCQLFRTTSCSPLSDNVFLIIIILAPFVKSEKLIYLF